MTAKRILLLDGAVLSAHYWSAGRVKVEAEFSHEPVGLEAFANYLKKHRSSLFYLLADVAEEGFQLEDLPYVQGGDRSALLQRRLSQYYYNTPLSTALSLGRAKEGRRDEKLLFAALTRVESFTPWLDTLRESEAILAGVYSIPLILSGFGTQLLGEDDQVLLVSLSRGGVRQTFFDQGKLHFSRLSQLATRSLDEVGRVVSGDSAKIFQYLVAQRQIARGKALRTVVLAHAIQIPTLQDYCLDTGELHFEFLELGATARKLGLKELPADSDADNLFMHLLATKTPAQQFAAASETRFYTLWRIRSALTNAGWIVLAACLMFAGKTGFEIYDFREQTEATKAITAAETQRYNGILEGLPKISLTPDNLRALISRFEILQKRIPGMAPLLVHLSSALNENPRIELVRLTWNIADSLDAAGKTAKETKGVAGAAPAAIPSKGWMILELRAQLPLVLLTDQRAQLELIEHFATRLRDTQTDVKILERPFDIESDKPLKSAGDAGQNRASDVPKFALRIARPM